MVEPSFQGVNRLFVFLAFEKKNAKSDYLLNVELKDYNIMINGENVFYQPEKNNEITCENIRQLATGQKDDYTTGYLLDCSYFKDSYLNDCSRFKQIRSLRCKSLSKSAN